MDNQPSGVVPSQSPETPNTTTEPAQTPTAAQTVPTPEPMQSPQTSTTQPVMSGVTPPKPKGGSVKKLGLLVGLGVVLLGASAAGYFGYVVPNQPDNILMEALANLARQDQVKLKAEVGYLDRTNNMQVALTSNIQTNRQANQFSIDGTFGMSGGRIDFDVRALDNSIYLKVGGLSGLSQLLDGEVASTYGPIMSQLDNQWYVVDETVTSLLGENCSLDFSTAFNDADINILTEAYKKHPLFKVTSSASEAVEGVDTTKYVVDPASDEEAAAFVKEIEELSVLKQAKACVGDEDASLDEEVKDITGGEAVGSSEIAFYITSDKQIKKISLKGEDDSAKMEFSGLFNFEAVTISAPEGAKPVQDLLGLLFSPGLTDTNNLMTDDSLLEFTDLQ